VIAVVALAVERLTKVFDDGTVAVDDLSIEVASGEFVVLLGPTGCGKSTILRLVAGLERSTSGRIRVDGRAIDDLSTRDRRVAMVFQDYALYPHLTVAENIAFPLRVGHLPNVDISTRVAETADILGIQDLLRRLPEHLSGGERQRVAMARAIVREPQLFLLDEPLSNLDAGLRAELRVEISGLARRLGVTTLYVTHDQTEAMTMADRVAVLRRGVLQQFGPPEEVYADPATLFVAAFLGNPRTNLLQAAVYAGEGGQVSVDLGRQVIGVAGSDPRAAALASRHTERVTVALRADALTPVPTDDTANGTAGAAANSVPLLHGRVRLVENLGHEALVYLDAGAVPTAIELSRMELPDTGSRLVELVAEEPPTSGALRQTLSRIRPPFREDAPGGAPVQGDLVVRVPAPYLPKVGESMTLAVDLDRMLLFDRAGNRIRLG
jgi:multiple sugar transport system ATP-binding protein